MSNPTTPPDPRALAERLADIQAKLASVFEMPEFASDLTSAAQLLVSYAELLEEAGKVLEPFAAHDGKRLALLDQERDLTISDGEWAFHMKVPDFRRAAQFLAKLRALPNPQGGDEK